MGLHSSSIDRRFLNIDWRLRDAGRAKDADRSDQLPEALTTSGCRGRGECTRTTLSLHLTLTKESRHKFDH
ncbi:hypothetical protein HPP92_008523 [Vanilla planifolia]|uniref:Uncharacterized protein n=1 Tax=Vanilla planifolia TaxID=51239 RepID=A0A835R4V8_VANPL|nr:hypothetical protein HPP92_008518 [Vanilla planifolia]KAG0484442.1 hypothetical protein HPP92_008521 [Vanilla planifolia]KAG0484444.1 hypothetical protein HPP92_008523 [Vanilla planifolia]